jgi:hypothetical protein
LHGGTPSDGPVLGVRFVNWNIAVTGPNPKSTCDGLRNYTSPCGPQYMVANAGDMPFGTVVGITLPGSSSIDPPFLYSPAGAQTAVPSHCLIDNSAPVPAVKNLYEAQLSCRIKGMTNNPTCPSQ